MDALSDSTMLLPVQTEVMLHVDEDVAVDSVIADVEVVVADADVAVSVTVADVEVHAVAEVEAQTEEALEISKARSRPLHEGFAASMRTDACRTKSFLFPPRTETT